MSNYAYLASIFFRKTKVINPGKAHLIEYAFARLHRSGFYVRLRCKVSNAADVLLRAKTLIHI